MNEFRRSELGPVSVIYFNDIPYYVSEDSGLVQIGDKGKHIKFFMLSESLGSGHAYKLEDDKFFVAPYNVGSKDLEFDIKSDNVIGVGVLDSFFVLFKKDGTIQDAYKPDKEYYLDEINGIKDVYNPGDCDICIIRDSSDKLYFLSVSADLFPVEGSKVLKLEYHRRLSNESSRYTTAAILTDKKLLFTSSISETASYPFLGKVNPLKPLKGNRPLLLMWEVPLPSDISPHDIKSMRLSHKSNLFLLTNDGKVYSIGKNGYNQRGTTKKLKPDEWNQIQYPEKIVSIESTYDKPGLFALSENGNLYYHGYNEGSYYPITNRKSNVSKPLKIAENIKSIWVSNMSLSYFYDTGENLISISDNEGNVSILSVKHKPSLQVSFPLLKDLRKGIVYNKNMLSTLLNHVWC